MKLTKESNRKNPMKSKEKCLKLCLISASLFFLINSTVKYYTAAIKKLISPLKAIFPSKMYRRARKLEKNNISRKTPDTISIKL